MAYDEYDQDPENDENNEEKMANDEISAEEEGFLKGYEEGGDFESEFGLNSDD